MKFYSQTLPKACELYHRMLFEGDIIKKLQRQAKKTYPVVLRKYTKVFDKIWEAGVAK